jgi:hypothetical protein
MHRLRGPQRLRVSSRAFSAAESEKSTWPGSISVNARFHIVGGRSHAGGRRPVTWMRGFLHVRRRLPAWGGRILARGGAPALDGRGLHPRGRAPHRVGRALRLAGKAAARIGRALRLAGQAPPHLDEAIAHRDKAPCSTRRLLALVEKGVSRLTAWARPLRSNRERPGRSMG